MRKVIFLPILLVLVFSSCKKQGCTDPNASNYNSSSKKDNGSCTYLLTDIDGNSYSAKAIGNQVWMTENLEVKKYRNGDIIPQVQDSSQWATLTTGAWCYYDNNPSKGILYNWYAVNDSRGIAPEGWHIPSDAEWTILTDYLGGDSKAAQKMKSENGWPNTSGTNESGFSGLPLGSRFPDGTFYSWGQSGFWWSSSQSDWSTPDAGFAYYRSLLHDNAYIFSLDTGVENALSVRCIKD